MIEMDRFVHSISKDEVQTIERKSQESASTMKFTKTNIDEYKLSRTVQEPNSNAFKQTLEGNEKFTIWGRIHRKKLWNILWNTSSSLCTKVVF